MTDKRKKLARTISKKTGVSYAGALNLLNSSKSEWEKLFVRDTFNQDPELREMPGGFFRAEHLQVYEKAPEETVLVIGEGGESIMAIGKARRVIVPLVEYKGTKPYIRKAITERMEALIETAGIGFGLNSTPEAPDVQNHKEFFEKEFGSLDGVHLFQLRNRWIGIKGKAGVYLFDDFVREEGMFKAHAGLAVWVNRIRACSVSTPHQGP